MQENMLHPSRCEYLATVWCETLTDYNFNPMPSESALSKSPGLRGIEDVKAGIGHGRGCLLPRGGLAEPQPRHSSWSCEDEYLILDTPNRRAPKNQLSLE